jgi:hypothetical protein
MLSRGIPQPKPEPRKRIKARAKRKEQAVAAKVRAKVDAADGRCRIGKFQDVFGVCGPRSEWAHFGEHKRFKTRGHDPEVRHTTAGSLMLCDVHHYAYDKGTGDKRLQIEAVTEDDCDGPLIFTMGGRVRIEKKGRQ